MNNEMFNICLLSESMKEVNRKPNDCMMNLWSPVTMNEKGVRLKAYYWEDNVECIFAKFYQEPEEIFDGKVAGRLYWLQACLLA